MNKQLYHYGVKGMKWGVRRYKEDSRPKVVRREIDDIKTYSKNGVEVSFSRRPTPLIVRSLSKVSKKMRDNVDRSDIMSINVKGEKVGDLQLYRESKKSINVVWVSVDKQYEGNGYGEAAMKAVIKYAKDTNCETVTLEVPGISPGAKHIYEKLGFESGKRISNDDDSWGGLTEMKLKLYRD